ncbi:MAG: hypothetical protein ACOYBC_05560 [Bilifractor sp.]
MREHRGAGKEGEGAGQEYEGAERGEVKNFEEIYHDVAVTCFRYFGFTTFEQVDNLTIRQYRIMLDALNLMNVDRDFYSHWIAYLAFAAQSMKKSGKKEKPVYSTFKKFYDYEKEVDKAINGSEKPKDDRFTGLAHYLHEKAEENK